MRTGETKRARREDGGGEGGGGGDNKSIKIKLFSICLYVLLVTRFFSSVASLQPFIPTLSLSLSMNTILSLQNICFINK